MDSGRRKELKTTFHSAFSPLCLTLAFIWELSWRGGFQVGVDGAGANKARSAHQISPNWKSRNCLLTASERAVLGAQLEPGNPVPRPRTSLQ